MEKYLLAVCATLKVCKHKGSSTKRCDALSQMPFVKQVGDKKGGPTMIKGKTHKQLDQKNCLKATEDRFVDAPDISLSELVENSCITKKDTYETLQLSREMKQ